MKRFVILFLLLFLLLFLFSSCSEIFKDRYDDLSDQYIMLEVKYDDVVEKSEHYLHDLNRTSELFSTVLGYSDGDPYISEAEFHQAVDDMLHILSAY